MSSDIKFIDWMICDDIRKEASGKNIYIGVYPDYNIIVQQVPVVLSKLIFLSKWNIKKFPLKLSFHINKPDGSELVKIDGEIPEKTSLTDIAHMEFGIGPFTLDEAGNYKVKVVIGKKEYKLGSFSVLIQTA